MKLQFTFTLFAILLKNYYYFAVEVVIGVGIAASFLIVTLLIVLLLMLCYWNRIKKLVMSGLFTICTH